MQARIRLADSERHIHEGRRGPGLTSKRNFEARDKAANTAEPTYAFLSRDNQRRDNAREWRAFSAASGNIWLRENAWWAREDSNLQPDRYERPGLTGKLR